MSKKVDFKINPKHFLIMVFMLLPMLSLAKRTIVKPSIKSSTSFAIITDSKTFETIRPSLEAYKTAIERDGLATYIVAGQWNSPDEVKSQLVELYNGKMPLEGAVFVGDIPVVMARDAQHFASAFKMNQKEDWKESSCGTDRFYDDFDLKWDFIKQDEEIPHFFYYSLRYDSPQKICTDIYTGRIRATGDDKYLKLEKYFEKVVKAHAQNNRLDDFFIFRGHAYNSEAKEGWSGEQITLREQIPSLFTSGNTVRFVDFETRYPVKEYVLEYLRRPTLDIALGHHHGSETRQYLNDNQNAATTSEAIEMIKLYLRTRVSRTKEDKAEAIKKWAAEIGVPESWIDTTAARKALDKERQKGMDIYLEDIYATNPNPRFIMFDACYNGSFHRDDCVANAYLFCNGNTVATQGNTLNSIQDKHPNAYIGLLASGMRIGQWSRYAQNFLGAHLVGDPTYRFANTATPDIDINHVIVSEAGNNDFWLDIIKNGKYAHSSSDWQAMAIRKLSDNKYENIEQLAFDTFCKSSLGSVRMECLKALYNMNSPKLEDIIIIGLNDSYELVRRFCAEYSGLCGDDKLIPAVVNAAINDRISLRVEYRAKDNLNLFPSEKVCAEIRKQFTEQTHLLNKEERINDMVSARQRAEKRVNNIVKHLTDNTIDIEERRQNIVTLRNYHYHHIVPQVIEFIEDINQPLELRICAVEALGWFRHSYRNPEISAACKRVIESAAPQELKNEAKKTLARLQ